MNCASPTQMKNRPPSHQTYLIIGLLQSSHSVASDCRVGELGRQQLQGVLHIHRSPLTQQLQSLLGLLRKVPVHTLEELCQSLEEEEEEDEEEVFDLCISERAAETTGEDTPTFSCVVR